MFDVPESRSITLESEIVRLGDEGARSCFVVTATDPRRISARAPVTASAGVEGASLPTPPCSASNVAVFGSAALTFTAIDDASAGCGLRAFAVTSIVATRPAAATGDGCGAEPEPSLVPFCVGSAVDAAFPVRGFAVDLVVAVCPAILAAALRTGEPKSGDAGLADTEFVETGFADTEFAASAQAAPAVPTATAVPIPRPIAKAPTRPTASVRRLASGSGWLLLPIDLITTFL